MRASPPWRQSTSNTPGVSSTRRPSTNALMITLKAIRINWIPWHMQWVCWANRLAPHQHPHLHHPQWLHLQSQRPSCPIHATKWLHQHCDTQPIMQIVTGRKNLQWQREGDVKAGNQQTQTGNSFWKHNWYKSHTQLSLHHCNSITLWLANHPKGQQRAPLIPSHSLLLKAWLQ